MPEPYYGRPTTYKGIRMRSRLEAATAAAFDRHNVPWEYEPEAFQAEDGTQYLPDFAIVIEIIDTLTVGKDEWELRRSPSVPIYVEVKPTLAKVWDAIEARVFTPLFEAGRHVACIVPTTGDVMVPVRPRGGISYHVQQCRRCARLYLGPTQRLTDKTGWYAGCSMCDSPRALLLGPLVPEDYSKAPLAVADLVPPVPRRLGALARYSQSMRGNT